MASSILRVDTLQTLDSVNSIPIVDLVGVSATGINQAIATKQSTLVSGVSIKTINGQSLLESGDIELTSKPAIMNANFNAEKFKSYLIIANIESTLPLGSTLTSGDSIRFAKTNANTPTLKCSGADLITYNGKTSNIVSYDANIEFIIVWNGTGWEI